MIFIGAPWKSGLRNPDVGDRIHAEDLIDRNRLLLKEAAIARGLTRQVVTMSAANCLMLHETAWL